MVPVAIFLRAAEATPASLAPGTRRRHYLVFEYLACKLGEIPSERWRDSDNLVARVVARLFYCSRNAARTVSQVSVSRSAGGTCPPWQSVTVARTFTSASRRLLQSRPLAQLSTGVSPMR